MDGAMLRERGNAGKRCGNRDCARFTEASLGAIHLAVEDRCDSRLRVLRYAVALTACAAMLERDARVETVAKKASQGRGCEQQQDEKGGNCSDHEHRRGT